MRLFNVPHNKPYHYRHSARDGFNLWCQIRWVRLSMALKITSNTLHLAEIQPRLSG